ncbi:MULTISPECIES: hypothetical protein [Megasphaera]
MIAFATLIVLVISASKK